MNENSVASIVRLTGAYRDIPLWRNNVGVLMNQDGRPVRYGLANDSKRLNKEIKSSDLIGITPVLITPDMIGQILGIFTAVETKHSEWVFSENDHHSVAQKKFHDIVVRYGGYAGFATNEKDFLRIIKHED